MTRTRIRPFWTVEDDRISFVEWHRLRGEASVPLKVDDWDPATDLHIQAEVGFMLADVMEDCGLQPGDEVRLFLGWSSSGTSIRGGHLAEQQPHADLDHHAIDCVVPGAELAGRLKLQVALVLARSVQDRPFVASRPGSVLWSDEVRVSLAGAGTRFPTEIVDFSSVPGMSVDAAWYLDWDIQGPAMPVLGGLRLMVNSRSRRVVSALTTGSTQPDALAIREAIRFDVARTMVGTALSLWQPADVEELDDDTVGEAVRRLIAALPGHPAFAEAQAIYASHPAEIEAGLQGFFRTFAATDEAPE